MLRPRHLHRPPERPQRLPAALDRHRGEPQLLRHPRRDLAAGPQPAVGRRVRQAGPQLVEQLRLQDRRSRPVAPSQVAERVRTAGVVPRQQLLDPPHPERGRRGHLGHLVALRQQPDRLDVPGRAGVRRDAEPLPQLRHAQVSRHLRHVSASRKPRPSLPAASPRRNRHRTHQPETVSRFRPWSAHGPPHHAIRGEPAGQSRGAQSPRELRPHVRPHRFPRPGDGTSGERDDPSPLRTRLPLPSDGHAAAASLPKRNSLPSTQRRWRTVASLRASATLARRAPRRFATSSAHRLRVENLPARVSMTFAASYKAARTIASPTLLIPPVTSVSPDWYLLGVSPKWAPTSRERRNRAGSSTAEAKVTAPSPPPPATLTSRRQTAPSRTTASTARCSTWYSARGASRARSIGPMTRSSAGWPAASSRTRAANRPLLTSPSLRPNPRRMPRRSAPRPAACPAGACARPAAPGPPG